MTELDPLSLAPMLLSTILLTDPQGTTERPLCHLMQGHVTSQRAALPSGQQHGGGAECQLCHLLMAWWPLA